MDTTTDITDLDLQAVRSFFLALGVELPESRDETILQSFKKAQDDHWGIVLQSFQKTRSLWAKEVLKLHQIRSAKSPSEKAIEAQEAVLAEFQILFDSAFGELMEGRGREEVARALPEALLGDQRAARFVGRQLQTARIYLRLS